MKKATKAPIRKWHLFGGRILVTRSPLYGIHIQVGRWLLARETREAQEATQGARVSTAKGKSK